MGREKGGRGLGLRSSPRVHGTPCLSDRR
jgi:hypothetical protein